MEISDELIACYVEGIATTEEQKFVRKYLCEHPEEYERILCLMDYDTIDFLGEQSKHTSNYILKNEKSRKIFLFFQLFSQPAVERIADLHAALFGIVQRIAVTLDFFGTARKNRIGLQQKTVFRIKHLMQRDQLKFGIVHGFDHFHQRPVVTLHIAAVLILRL